MNTGFRPRRRFAQNFLVDPAMVKRIVRAIAPAAGDRVLEIGPGRGALTEQLRDVAELVAVEIDRDLAAQLETRMPGLDVRAEDVLRSDLRALMTGGSWRVVGNLPYNISTPVLFRLLEVSDAWHDALFMLQDEVVARMCAEPGTRAWGRLAVMLQYRCRVQSLFRVPPECFRPRPRVISRIVRLQPRPPQAVPQDFDWFAQVVRVAFSQRRKTLRNALKSLLGDADPAALAPGVDWSKRPETLTIDAFVGLADALLPVRRA